MEPDLTAASSAVGRHGCSFVSGSAFSTEQELAAGPGDFSRAWFDLPVDPYIDDRAPYRFRRHARILFDPLGDRLHIQPPGDYIQSTAHNKLFGGIARRFAPVHWDATSLQFCTALVRINCVQVLRLRKPALVNLHMVRIVGGRLFAGEPTPEGPHRDGFDYISVHLVACDVDHGGTTSVIADTGEVYAVATLGEPLDAMYVDDRRLLHYTSPISSDDRDARRDVLLMSYEDAP